MAKSDIFDLSRRERQILDAVYSLGEATAKEIMATIPSPPTYAAVRRLISILEEKGFLTHYEDGPRYVYKPVISIESARENAISHLTNTFFRGSTAMTVAAILDLAASDLEDKELEEITEMIKKAKKEGR